MREPYVKENVYYLGFSRETTFWTDFVPFPCVFLRETYVALVVVVVLRQALLFFLFFVFFFFLLLFLLFLLLLLLVLSLPSLLLCFFVAVVVVVFPTTLVVVELKEAAGFAVKKSVGLRGREKATKFAV